MLEVRSFITKGEVTMSGIAGVVAYIIISSSGKNRKSRKRKKGEGVK